jgi:hypothetical protein
MNYDLITVNELRQVLLEVPHQTMISLVSVVEPDLKAKDADKRPNPFMLGARLADGFDLAKVNKVSGSIDYDYNRLVRNRNKAAIIQERLAANLPPLDADALEAEADARHAKGSSWFRYIERDGRKTCLVVNKKSDDNGAAYLAFAFKSKGQAQFYRLGGQEVAFNDIAPWHKEASAPTNQGLTDGDEVRVATYALESIIEICVNRKRYRLIDTLTTMSQTLRNEVWAIADAYIEGELKMRNI